MDVAYAVARNTSIGALPPPPAASRRVRRLCLLALIVLTVCLARVGAHHIYWQHPDFEYFYKAGAWLLDHGSLDRGYDVSGGQVTPRGTLDWYWPFVHRLMSILAVLPYRPAGYVWLALNLAAMLTTIRLIGRHLTGLPPQDWPVTQLVAFAILLAYWLWEFRLNQINILTMLLVVGSFVCWQQGRSLVAGFWLGLAVLLKLTPGLLILWFLLKRQYRTALAAILTVALAGPVADVITLRPELTADSYRAWAQKAVTSGSQRGMVLAQQEVDWRNQGLGAVLSRWLHPTNYNTHFDNDPRIQAEYADGEVRTLNLASLSLPTIANIVTAITAASLLGLIWLARRPASQLTLWQLRFEWALFMLATLWLMPVMRRYHMIWTLPALSLLGAGIHYSTLRSGWSKLAIAAIGVMVLIQVALPAKFLRDVGLANLAELATRIEASGVILGSVVVLAIPMIVLLVRLGRHPAALPEPCYFSAHPAASAAQIAPVARPMPPDVTPHA